METYLEAGATSEPSVTPIVWTNIDVAHSVEDRPHVLRLKTHSQPNIITWQTGQMASNPPPVATIISRMSNLAMVDEPLGNKQESKIYNTINLEQNATHVPLMSEHDPIKDIKNKPRKPSNKCYERRQEGRKAESEARAQQMSEVYGEIESLLPEVHYLETTWMIPESKCHQYVDLIDFAEPTKTEILVESELKEVPCQKKKAGKAQWNNCYRKRLARRKAERDARAQQMSEAAEECKSFFVEYVATKVEDNSTPLIDLAGTSQLQNVTVTQRNVTIAAEICDRIDLITYEAQPEVHASNYLLTLIMLNDPATDLETSDKCLYFGNPGLNMDDGGDAAHLTKV